MSSRFMRVLEDGWGDGYDFIHAAVDDRSRLAYAEILPDERKENASAFMTRAIGFFAERSITVERVLTDIQTESSPGGPWIVRPAA